MAFIQEDFKITCGTNTIAATRFIPKDIPVIKRILSLHGAGKATRQRIFYLADDITSKGGEFVCFDFSGHGESSGKMTESSLRLRRDEALCVIDAAFKDGVDVLMGNSMGGYVLLELLPFVSPEAILLLCPAMYDKRAFEVLFTDDFTAILRDPGSYKNNHASEYLKEYSGRVLLGIGENDDVIPDEVMDIYEAAASNASEFQKLVFPDAPHTLHVWAVNNPSGGAIFKSRILNFIFK